MNKFADEIFLTGYSKLPANITASKLYEVIAVGLLVKTNSSEIIDAECTLSTNIAKKFVSKMFIGKYLNDIDDIYNIIDISYFGSAKKALKTAIFNCKKKYDSVFTEED